MQTISEWFRAELLAVGLKKSDWALVGFSNLVKSDHAGKASRGRERVKSHGLRAN